MSSGVSGGRVSAQPWLSSLTGGFERVAVRCQALRVSAGSLSALLTPTNCLCVVLVISHVRLLQPHGP